MPTIVDDEGNIIEEFDDPMYEDFEMDLEADLEAENEMIIQSTKETSNLVKPTIANLSSPKRLDYNDSHYRSSENSVDEFGTCQKCYRKFAQNQLIKSYNICTNCNLSNIENFSPSNCEVPMVLICIHNFTKIFSMFFF